MELKGEENLRKYKYLGDKVYSWMRNINTWEVKIMIIGEFGRSLVTYFKSFYQSPSKFRKNHPIVGFF